MKPLYLAAIGCILLLCLSATAQANDPTCLNEFAEVAYDRLKYDLDRAITDMDFQRIQDKYTTLKYEAIQLCRGI